ncbi:MAG TPA: Glu/Leu/Phe/Val dehydrogenase dimerization domain-containing protein [Gemmatimonadaceae bacterium]
MTTPIDLVSTSAEQQLVCVARDGNDVLGYVAIDSTVGGRSRGGLRMVADVDEAEVRGLARAMTLKYGFLGLPQGGAKAGVRGDPEAPAEERRARLAAFARLMAPLLRSRVFTPDTDMGTTRADIAHVLAVAGAPVPPRSESAQRSGFYTALTVRAAARVAAQRVGLELAGARVAIEGFGSVGASLAMLLHDVGARVVAVSTTAGALYAPDGLDVARLVALAADHGSRVVDAYAEEHRGAGAERLDRAALLVLPVDVLCPCARHGSVHGGNVADVQARVVASGANNPLTPDAERALDERGVACVPDFVANSGGVLGGTMEFAAVPERAIAAFVDDHFAGRVAWLLAEAARAGEPTRTVAERVALARRLTPTRQPAWRKPLGSVLGSGLALYRRGLVPAAVVGRLSLPYFRRSMA